MMKHTPKVSVIMGIYNCADTLPESINSILNQTYKDFELIMCDDGSIDNTYAVAEKYALLNNNIVLLKNSKNRGLNYTLNHCLKYVQGAYIARQDGDDISLPTRFEKEIAILESDSSIAIVSTSMVYFDEFGDFKVGRVVEYPTKYDFVKGSPFCHAPSMIRRNVLEQVGGYSEGKRLLRVEDYHLWFKIYALNFIGYNLQEPLYKMRDDQNAYKRRKMKFRFNEAYVKYIGFRMLRLPFYYYIYVFRPVIVGLLPYRLYNMLHR